MPAPIQRVLYLIIYPRSSDAAVNLVDRSFLRIGWNLRVQTADAPPIFMNLQA